jgi:phosphinothricin acetyltransferase
MDIRYAQPPDLAALTEIYNQAIFAGQKTADLIPVTVEQRRQWLVDHPPQKYPVLIAEKDKRVIGYLSISPYRAGRQALRFTAEVSYYVHFEFQRQGVATKLLEFALDLCPKLQIKTLFAILLDTNHASIKLLQKFGFQQWGHLPKVADFNGTEIGHLYYGRRLMTKI